MITYILKRLMEAIPVLLVIATLTFFMLQIAPGGPFDQEKPLPPDIEANLKAHYGLDQPLWVQYKQFLWRLCHGDLGPSFKYPGRTVNEIIGSALPVSAELGFYALILALVMGIGIGILASINRGSCMDYIPMSLAMMGICLPAFVVGPLLILVFGLWLGWFEVGGWYYMSDRFLPALTLAVFYGAYIARLTRGSMLDVLRQDYIRTARAKGLGWGRVYFIHGLRNALTPVISYLGPAAAGLISGSFVVETIYNIPGLGRRFVDAALNRDYTLVLGTVLLYAVVIIALNLVADMLLVRMNPREKFK